MAYRDPEEGERLKKDGMHWADYGGSPSKRARKLAWRKAARERALTWIDVHKNVGDLITGDDIHLAVGAEPPVYQQWGKLTHWLSQTMNVIEATGHHTQSDLPKNHRSRAIWWRVIGGGF